MQTMKEATASAKAGMEKSKASADERVDKMKTRDPMEKAAAEQRKEERIMEAEAVKQKQGEKQVHAAETGHGTTTGGNTGHGTTTTGGVTGHKTTGGFGSSV